jgi:hypothetical protein
VRARPAPAARPGRSTVRQAGAPIVLPLAAHYARSPEFEKRRMQFYAAIAREFGDWRLDPEVGVDVAAEGGRDGVAQKLRKSGDAFTTRKYINIASAPLEFLYQTNVLADRVPTHADELALRAATSANGRRWQAGIQARQDFSGEMVSAIKSVDFLSSGGGGGGGRPVADYAIDCLKSVGRLRTMMPAEDMRVLEAVVHADRWIWKDGAPSAYSADPAERRRQQQAETRRRAPIYEAIRRALDYAALRYGLLTAYQFVCRWPLAEVRCPIIGPAVEKATQQRQREAAMAIVKQIGADLRDFIPQNEAVVVTAVVRRHGDKLVYDNPLLSPAKPSSGR